IAVPGKYAGPAYFSADYGNTWTQSLTPDRVWYGVASSADGLALAGITSSVVLTSTNGGLNWSTNSPPPVLGGSWSTIASSADGQKLIVAATKPGATLSNPSPVYTSTNAGLSWTSNSLPADVDWTA